MTKTEEDVESPSAGVRSGYELRCLEKNWSHLRNGAILNDSVFSPLSSNFSSTNKRRSWSQMVLLIYNSP